MNLHELSDRKKGSIRIMLLLCGLWFCYLALKDESLFNLVFPEKQMMTNKVLVTIVTTIATTVPTFFAVAMFKESFLVKQQAIYYYQRLIDTKSFWILAGLIAFLFGGIALPDFISTLSPQYAVIPLVNFVVGVYLIIFGIKPSFALKKSVGPVTPGGSEGLPASSYATGPRILFRDEVFPLSKNFTTIGRGKKADIKIPDPKEVINPVHVGILRDEHGYWVVDNDSVNGTFVFQNGAYKRVTKWALYDGDVIALCYNPAKGPYMTLQFKLN